MTEAQAARVVELLEQQNTLLTALLREQQSWRPPEMAACPHPDDALENLSSMGTPWVRCRACGANVRGGPS